jgi:hypothetical protein
MHAFLLGFFRLVFLFGKDHRAVVLENLCRPIWLLPNLTSLMNIYA